MAKRLPRKKKPTAQRTVDIFEKAQNELHQFIEENDELIDELRRLVDEHNATLKEAQVSIKNELKRSDDDRLVIGCIGAMKKRKEFWDGTALAKLFPAILSELFLEEQVNYEVNVTKLEQLIRQGEIDRDRAYKAFQINDPTMSLMSGCPKELMI